MRPAFSAAPRWEWGALVLRLTAGGIFLAHGLNKIFGTGIPQEATFFAHLGIPSPRLGATLVALAEILCGGALLAGLLTRAAAAILAAIAAAALLLVHLEHGFFLPGVEYVLTLIAVNLTLVLTGPGRLALAHRSRDSAGGSRPESA